MKLADLIYIISPSLFEKLKDYKKIKFWDYHYPVSEEFFSIQNKNFKLKSSYTLGYIGSLIKEKGLGVIISALTSSELNNFKLKIIGGKEREIEELQYESKKLGINKKIKFLGFLPQNRIIEELHDIDILVAPFTKQQTTIPLKIYEYIATGLPIISSDLPAIKSIGRDFIYYFHPENVNSLIITLKNMINNPDEVNSKISKIKNYRYRFKWDNVIEKMIEDLSNID